MRPTWSCCRLPRAAFGFGSLLFLWGAAGCGQSPGHVSGQVLFNGKPLPGGYITFLPKDPKYGSVATSLDEQGHFSVTLPAGEVRVGIDNRELEPRKPIHFTPKLPASVGKAIGNPPPEPAPAAPPAAAGGNSSRYVKIPDKYYDAATSGLDFKVQSGDQTHNIELS